ncbi:MAG: hypothetical protein COA79_12205 [Planctomycetota bacterium]|nr:MAG: hypothetical protein COA79_12205 [Planctomycetota bacterium]
MKFGKDIDVIEQLQEVLETSNFIKTVKRVNQNLFSVQGPRELRSDEIKVLELQKNFCKDWSLVKVSQDFSTKHIINNTFLGNVLIGKLSGNIEVDGFLHESGILNSVLYDVQIGDNCLVKNVQTVSDIAMESSSAIVNCLSVVHGNQKTFGVGEELALAIEIGGREIRIFPEINLDVARIICSSRDNLELLKQYSDLIDEYVSLITSRWSILCKGSKIINSPKIKNVYLGEYAFIDNVLNVENTVLICSKDEPAKITNGAFVSNSVVQWGCHITTGSVVENSILTEYSTVKRQGMVFDSLIGANTSIAEGEVSSSLVGNFVGFHHQALLISAFWPEGKGNISYGANVGSNHTGKEPDQEIWLGEGTFMGLSVVIKFPTDFTQGPYSIVSSGLTTLPQKMEFPFSLLNSASHSYDDISPAFNEILPAWVLYSNYFMIQRNEKKFRERNKAKRIEIKNDIIRPSIVDKMISAKKRLMDIKKVKEIYTESDIKGLGKNYLVEENRNRAIAAYTGITDYFCYRELYRKLIDIDKVASIKGIKKVDFNKGSLEWLHAKKIFLEQLSIDEFTVEVVKECFNNLIGMVEDIANQIHDAKKRDDVRGKKIIRDYEYSHCSADDNAVVKSAFEDLKEYRIKLGTFLK